MREKILVLSNLGAINVFERDIKSSEQVGERERERERERDVMV
jgi:hypothetical protein